MATCYKFFQFQISLLALATFIDGMYNASGVKEYWENRFADWWVKLGSIGWIELAEINDRFQDLFTSMYGGKIFSFKRILTSSISSIVFVLCIFYMITSFSNGSNYETKLMLGSIGSQFFSNTVSTYSFRHILLLIYLAITINLAPDFISLAETGWILKISQTKRKFLLPIFFLLDLLLSTLIFVFWNLYLVFFDPVISEWAVHNSIMSLYSFDGSGSPLYISFLISTYATSFLWFFFILTVLILGILKRISNTLSFIIESRLFLKLPVSTVIASLCLLSWPIFLVFQKI